MGRLTNDPRTAAMAAAGASLALYLAPWYLPLAGALFTVWAPAPLVLLYHSRGLKAGRMGLAAGAGGAVLILAALGSPTGGLFYLFHAALALALGEGPFRGRSPAYSVAAAAGAALAVFLVLAWASGALSAQWLNQLLEVNWRQAVESLAAMNRDSGMDQAQSEYLGRVMMNIGGVLLRLSPGMLASGALLLAWSNLLLVRRINRAPLREQGPLDGWRAPEPLVWVLIPAGAAMALGSGFWFWAGANAVLVLTVIYFFQGMAVLAYWLRVKKAPGLLRWVIYLMVALEMFMAVLVAAVGLFDMWFNFRRMGKQAPAA